MTWQLLIDWNDDLDFSDANEDITGDVMGNLRWELGMRPFENIADENVMKITVNNDDRKYSPEYSSSPLYGMLLPNLLVQLKYDSVVMWQGLTRDVRPDPFLYGKQTATIECQGIKAQLQEYELYTKLYNNVTADIVIADIITQIAHLPITGTFWMVGEPGFSELGQTTYLGQVSDYAILGEGIHIFPYVGDNLQGADSRISAWALIKSLMEVERGHFFLRRDGKVEFWNRHRLLDDTTVDVTIDNTADDIKYATPIEDLVNFVEVECYPRNVSTSTDDLLWQLPQTVTIAPGETETLLAPYVDSNGIELGGEKQRVPGTDLNFARGTADVSYAHFGQRSEITIENTGATEALLDTLNLRGSQITARTPMVARARDDASIELYGKRPMKLNLRLLDDLADAKSIAQYELILRSSVLGRAESVTLEEQITASTDTQIAKGIGDLVRLIDDQLAHDRNYHIIGERHNLDVGNNILKTEWMLQPVPEVTFWLVGVTGFGELGQTTYLGY